MIITKTVYDLQAIDVKSGKQIFNITKQQYTPHYNSQNNDMKEEYQQFLESIQSPLGTELMPI